MSSLTQRGNNRVELLSLDPQESSLKEKEIDPNIPLGFGHAIRNGYSLLKFSTKSFVTNGTAFSRYGK